jgi:hypothetical protein
MATPPTSVSGVDHGRLSTDGFLLLPDLVPASTVEALRVEAQRLLEHRLADAVTTRTPDPRMTWWRLASGRPYVLKIKPVVDLAPTAAAVAEDLRPLVAALLGPAPRLMDNKFMYSRRSTCPPTGPRCRSSAKRCASTPTRRTTPPADTSGC